MLLEDHGNVVVRERPPRWCPVLLRILASGDASNEKFVAGLWGLRAYHPEIHDEGRDASQSWPSPIQAPDEGPGVELFLRSPHTAA